MKPAGKPAKASFTLTARPQQSTRLDDIAIDGSGAVVKGSLELDSAGDLVVAVLVGSAQEPAMPVSDLVEMIYQLMQP